MATIKIIRSIISPVKKGLEIVNSKRAKKPFIDNYINDNVSETIGSSKGNAIAKLLDELHPDIVKLFNNSDVIKYKTTSTGLHLELANGIVAKINPLADQKNHYILKIKNRVIIDISI
jgi:hypothetical protein